MHDTASNRLLINKSPASTSVCDMTRRSAQSRRALTRAAPTVNTWAYLSFYHVTLYVTDPGADATLRFLGPITELLFDAPRKRGPVALELET